MYEKNQIRIRKFDVNFCIKHVAVYFNYPLILRCSTLQGKNQSSGNFFCLLKNMIQNINDIETRS